MSDCEHPTLFIEDAFNQVRPWELCLLCERATLRAERDEAVALLREARDPLEDALYCEKEDCIACRIGAFLAKVEDKP